MNPQEDIATSAEIACFHCGDPVHDGELTFDGKPFCCAGCRAVYQILSEQNLHRYYDIYRAPGRSSTFSSTRFAYLDDPHTAQHLCEFSDDTTSTLTLLIPQMHCASCVWLLEQLHTLDPGITSSRVDFLQKQIHIRFVHQRTTLRRIVELLASLGYEPLITLESDRQAPTPNRMRSLYYRIGVAGFAFGNIMLLSLPEYLSGGNLEPDLRVSLRIFTLLLSLPVVFYAGAGYFTSAFVALRKKIVNLDVPLALGIGILFLRSLYEIGTGTGAGYLDSMSGLVLFLLIGRIFQEKTFENLNFERTFKSYFPLAVTVLEGPNERTVPVSRLVAGNRILLRNGELAAADSVLRQGRASIDYSFVTGESRPVDLAPGALVYAGGRQVGGAIELEVVKPVSESYLARLWNDAPASIHHVTPYSDIANTTGRYFTAGIVLLAAIAGAIWAPVDMPRAWSAITAILIVACPCAIALAVPFAFGTTLRILGRNGLFLKNTGVVETLARLDTIVFDKTGTITHPGSTSAEFVGETLTLEERHLVASLVHNSHHPLSRTIYAALRTDGASPARNFSEQPGSGIAGVVDGKTVRLGSRSFVSGTSGRDASPTGAVAESRVYLALDNSLRGFFQIQSTYREGIAGLVQRLKERYGLLVVSGDSPGEEERLRSIFGEGVPLRFRISPAGKREVIDTLRREGHAVGMIGDGLNDAGALMNSDAGIAVTEDIADFSPACDAILEARSLEKVDYFLRFAHSTVRIVRASFALSLLYNSVGLYVAFTGELSPLIAAILMPASSISVVAFTTLTVRALARRRGLL